jgi:Xaa-Pro aminopeptidase
MKGMLTLDGCRARQRRLLAQLESNRCDLFVTTNFRTVYYFTGMLVAADTPVIFAAWHNGATALVAPAEREAAADEIVTFETYSIDRSITMPAHDASRRFGDYLARKASGPLRRCAVERTAVSGYLEKIVPAADFFDATSLILALRKKKDDDEILAIRESLRYCATAYRAAKQTIAPGLTELDVYNAMYNAIVQEAGTVFPFPGDFACGTRAIKEGGPPTRRAIELHDLYTLDIFPAPALYAGDTCRTFAVGEPTDLQHRAWEIVSQAVRLGESMIKPGVEARHVYRGIKEFLDSHELSAKSFWHHAGHGIGHHGHEAPRIIPGSTDIFEVGDVIALEPGIYGEALQGGIRLEDNYMVRERGLENLFDFPREL